MKARSEILISAPSEAQHGNKKWWTDHTMSCDWKKRIQEQSSEWFGRGRQALYGIGAALCPCGLAIRQNNSFCGYPRQARAGGRLRNGPAHGVDGAGRADVVAIVILPKSVAATRTRLAQKGIKEEVIELDAEHLDAVYEFDFIWPCGVIHHSARSGFVRNLALKPGKELRFMVYNLEGMQAYTVIVRYLVGFWFGHSFYSGRALMDFWHGTLRAIL